ncbi:hypothetical protein AB1285_15635 [Microbacterium sp. NRRL B-14842]|uniref:hypothetical protein n=1 Tax=Microbacterium sp. NRRL B-14842 TaxID=3162881 RepID=UPI0035141072
MSDTINDVFDLVPAIGDGTRWYDPPYRLLMWLSSGWRRKVQPQFLRTLLNKGVNYLLPFNQHDRDFAWPRDDRAHGIQIPPSEHVNVAGLWLVELFPPADLPALERGLARNGWDKPRLFAARDKGNRETLAGARAGNGSTWWHVASLIRKGSTWWGPDAIRSELPASFETVELRAIQVGDGLTALVCAFNLTDAAAKSLDEAWHTPHEPFMRYRPGSRPRSFDRHWGTFWKVQSVRRAIHDEARSWLTGRLPGFFGRRGEPQPSLDMLLLDQLDPTRPEPHNISREKSLARSDALRALAVDSRPVYHLTSDDMPKLLLDPVSPSMHQAMGEAPAWALWGKRDAVVEALGEDELAGYSGDVNRAIAHRLGENMYNLFVMMGVSRLLAIAAREQAAVRDSAANLHGKFRPKALRALRQSFLTLSLDLSSLHRDVKRFWERDWRWEGEARFVYTLAPMHRRADAKAGRKVEEPIDYNEALQDKHESTFANLIESDRDLREILSTVASLGASADSFKLGRLALWVAIVSLVIAVGTILVTEVGTTSILGWILAIVQNWINPGPAAPV